VEGITVGQTVSRGAREKGRGLCGNWGKSKGNEERKKTASGSHGSIRVCKEPYRDREANNNGFKGEL